MRHEEGGVQPVQCLLDAFMAHPVGMLEHGNPTTGGRRQENSILEEDDIIDDGPA
jgi:hypothetical protein